MGQPLLDVARYCYNAYFSPQVILKTDDLWRYLYHASAISAIGRMSNRVIDNDGDKFSEPCKRRSAAVSRIPYANLSYLPYRASNFMLGRTDDLTEPMVEQR